MSHLTNPCTIAKSGLENPLTCAGEPGTATNEVWRVVIGGEPAEDTASTFKLKAAGVISDAIAWSATNDTLVSAVQDALDDLETLGSGATTVGTTTMTEGVGTLTITMAGTLAGLPLPTGFFALGDNSLLGTTPTIAVAKVTSGVAATGRGAATGAKLIDTTNGVDYINTGTPIAPTWTKTGTQS